MRSAECGIAILGSIDGVTFPARGTRGQFRTPHSALRIRWAAAKRLAHEAGLELRAIPSLMAAAAGAAPKLGAEPVAACFDALRGQVYGAVYVFHPDRVETLVAPCVLTVPELARVAS